MTSSRNFYGIELSRRNGQQNHGQNPSGSERVAVSSTDPVYPFVFMDCIHYRSPEDIGSSQPRFILYWELPWKGYKDILSITVERMRPVSSGSEWLNDLKNRGVQDVLFFCVDGLPS